MEQGWRRFCRDGIERGRKAAAAACWNRRRGLGIGKRLLEECARFARQAGDQRIALWTQSILHAGRHIYKQVGFRVVQEEQDHSFGKDLTAETWEFNVRTTTSMCAGLPEV